MLTNFYYCNYYKPYIFKPEGSQRTRAHAVSAAAKIPKKADTVALLDKTAKIGSLSFAQSLANSIVSVKESSLELKRSVRRIRQEGLDEESSDELLDGALDFADSFNELKQLAVHKQAGTQVNQFMNENSEKLSGDILRNAGFVMSDEDDGLKIDLETLKNAFAGRNDELADTIDNVASSVYTKALEFMSQPITKILGRSAFTTNSSTFTVASGSYLGQGILFNKTY